MIYIQFTSVVSLSISDLVKNLPNDPIFKSPRHTNEQQILKVTWDLDHCALQNQRSKTSKAKFGSLFFAIYW